MLKISPEIQIPSTELKFHFARSPGPGGQNVNKVNSKAILKWDVKSSAVLPSAVKSRFLAKYSSRISKAGLIIVTSHRYRDQGRNVADCTTKLRLMIESVIKPPTIRKKTKPSKGSQRRRLEAKKKKSATKLNRRPPSLDS